MNACFTSKTSNAILEDQYLGQESVQDIKLRIHEHKYIQKYAVLFGFTKEQTFDRIVPLKGMDSIKNTVLFDRLMTTLDNSYLDINKVALN